MTAWALFAMVALQFAAPLSAMAVNELVYAHIEDAELEEVGGGVGLLLRGQLDGRCSRLREVRVSYQDSTITVEPITETIALPHNCGHELVAFEHHERIDLTLRGNLLLTVRSAGGRTMNKLIQLRE